MGSPDIAEEEISAVNEVLESGWITQGKKTEQFEASIRQATHADHAVAMNNGTATLHACVASLDPKHNSEIIVPSLTYISSLSTILLGGAKPVFVDCDPETFNITPEKIEAALTENTIAVMTVDMKGMPVDFDAIQSILPPHITHISDSAESLGAGYKGKPVGTQADVHSFSFFANKNITTGEGGALTTCENSASDQQFFRKFRNQGQSNERYIHDQIGFNYRFNDLAAAIGIQQLLKLDGRLQRKNEIARRYNQAFSDQQSLALPRVPEYVSQHSWYNYCLRFKNNSDRDRVQKHLAMCNIETRVSFPPCHKQPYLKKDTFRCSGRLEVTEYLFHTMLDIPCHHALSDVEVERVSREILRVLD